MEKVFSNLIGNAIKYSPQGAFIYISVHTEYRQIETSLDKGIQRKEAKKVLPTLHKTPPNGTIGGVFVCGGKSLNPGPRGYAAPIVIRRYLQAWQAADGPGVLRCLRPPFYLACASASSCSRRHWAICW